MIKYVAKYHITAFTPPCTLAQSSQVAEWMKTFSTPLELTTVAKTFLSFLFLFFTLSSASAQVESKSFDVLLNSMLSNEVPAVSVEQLSKENLKEITLLDAREKKEYNVSHLKNARWIGYDDFNMQRVSGISKDAPIVIYCSIGVRSEKIGKRLQDAGFTNVHNLYGSIFEWVNQGNPVYENSGKRTNKVHAYNRIWGVWLNKGEKVY